MENFCMHSKWKDKLYVSGYLLTSNRQVIKQNIGLDWNKWQCKDFGTYVLFTHPEQKVFSFKKDNRWYVIVGHAYNPFTMEMDENDILEHIAGVYMTKTYQDYFDQLTGLFFYVVIDGNRLVLNTDCAGMLPAYYAKINDEIYCSAYAQLIADLCSLQEDEYVTHLKKSRLFHLYGWFLPGDLSPYKEVKRIVANTEIRYNGEFSCHRFYPRKDYYFVKDSEYPELIKNISEILHNNIMLISQKWRNPAISLTGGMDSQTTLACAGDMQGKFEYFSYISLPREATDANAAHNICDSKGLKHTIYSIDTDKTHYSDFEEVDALVERHYSYLGKGNPNDICKRISLSKQLSYDIEVKSWVSEVARASRYKIYGKTEMPKMTARRLTSMYKVFTINRGDAIKTDNRFRDYLTFTGLQKAIEQYHYPWTEFFVWEIVFGCWGGLALTGEHKLTNDITIPYNNRTLLDLMLKTPLEKRISDQVNKDIIRYMDNELYALNVHVVNGNETKKREIGEKLYFEIHSRIPW